MRDLHNEGDVWIARAARSCGGRYRLSVRPQPDGSGDLIYDVARLVSERLRQL